MSKTPAAPPHLSAEMTDWWRSVLDCYELEEHHLKLLRLACETWDRAQSAREIVERDGITVTDRFGQVKTHPLVQARKEAEASFAALLRQLDLDGSPDPSQRRPQR